MADTTAPASDTARDARSDMPHDTARRVQHDARSDARRRPFERTDGADGDEMVSIRIPRSLRDRIEAERDRIEPATGTVKRRSMDHYAGRVVEKGLDWLATVEPARDPLA